MSLSKVRVVVSYQSPDMIHAVFSDSINDLIIHSMSKGIEVVRNRTQSTMIEIGRGVQAHNALHVPGATHILCLDSDMKFPPDTLERLLAHDKAIVGCTYSQRVSPRGPTHRDMDGEIKLPPPYDAPWSGAKRGLSEVQSMGLGCMLVHLNVFRKVPRPWFKVEYTGNVMPDGSDEHTSEDVMFFERARNAGYSAFCDWRLSREIRHCGMFQFGLEHIEVMTGYLP